jgi:Arc/MetJ-type ribon-helix-helix transcriptional regulator
MKMSVSLGEDEVAFLDDYAATHGIASRSAVLQQALALLRANELADAYVNAWDEWEESGEAALWAATAGDDQGDGKDADATR